MRTRLIALVAMTTLTAGALAKTPVVVPDGMERGKFVRARRIDGDGWKLFALGVVGAAVADAASGKPGRNMLVCTYKAPSGATWEDTMAPPCASFSNHLIKPADAPVAPADESSNTPANTPAVEGKVAPPVAADVEKTSG
jgi:hypothetical protein